MQVEIKLVNDRYIGYIKINHIRIYAFESTSLESNLKGLMEWVVVKKHDTIYF